MYNYNKDHCPLSEGNRPLKLSNGIGIIRVLDVLFDKGPEGIRKILSFLILLMVLHFRLNFDVIMRPILTYKKSISTFCGHMRLATHIFTTPLRSFRINCLWDHVSYPEEVVEAGWLLAPLGAVSCWALASHQEEESSWPGLTPDYWSGGPWHSSARVWAWWAQYSLREAALGAATQWRLWN